MTDRYPKPVKDEVIISSILEMIYPDILTLKRQENQRDIFRVSFVNEGVLSLYSLPMDDLNIDFSLFDSQLSRIDYVKNRSNPSLSSDVKDFRNTIDLAYNKAQNETYGADIWSFFNGLDEYTLKDTIRSTFYEGVKYTEVYKNVMILLTDGYLEAGIYNKNGCERDNLCYFMSGRTISQFRKAFRASGSSDMKQFFDQNDYGIVPVKNESLSKLDVILLEAYDRSLDRSGNATVYPADFEIMKLFWEDWMTKSGVGSFEIHRTAATEEEAIQTIKKFVGIY